MDTRDARPQLIVLGGFLGAGKTTMLLRLAEWYGTRGRTVGVIANDQGEELIDTERFRAAGLGAAEVTGGCFCCRFDDFVQRADELIAAHRPDVLLAEPVGSCTDLVATVLNPLRRLFPDRFALAPFTVAVDAVRALDLLGKRADVSLSEKVTYIFRMQQHEADGVAINKIDLLSAAERAQVRSLIAAQFPHAHLLALSAQSGEGVAALVDWLESGTRSERPAPDVDYDVYAAGEAELGWLNGSARVHSAAPLDVDDAALALATDLAEACAAHAAPVVHAKLLLRGTHRTAIVSLTGMGADPQLAQRAGDAGTALDLLVNLRIHALPAVVRAALEHAVALWAARRQLRITDLEVSAFQPPCPVPTHRIAALAPSTPTATRG